MTPAEIAEALRIAMEAREQSRRLASGMRTLNSIATPYFTDVPALAALVERMAGELARLPCAERVAEMRTRVDEGLDDPPNSLPDAHELLRLLAEDLSDVLRAFAPSPTKTT